MDAPTCWQSFPVVSSKPLRSFSLPVGFCSGNEALFKRASSSTEPIKRSMSACFNCQLVEDSSVKSSFKTQLLESRNFLKSSCKNRICSISHDTKVRCCPYIFPHMVNLGARKLLWHNGITGSPPENEVDMGAGICRASSGDNWDESLGGSVEDVILESYLNEKDVEEEIPVSYGEVASEVPLGTLYSNENSLVRKDLRASLGSLYFSRMPFGKAEGLSSSSLEQGSKERKEHSNQRGLNSVGIQAGAVKMPLSLRILKRRQQKQAKVSGNRGTDVRGKLMGMGESFKRAFSSMVFIIRILQSHTFHIRQVLFCEDVQEFVNIVHREMHLSFLWLFQQVFACTPKLMLLVMVFLADFTVFSVGNNVALANSPAAFPSTLVSVCDELQSCPEAGSVIQFVGRSEGNPQVYLRFLSDSPSLGKKSFSLLDVDDGGAKNGGSKGLNVADGEGGDACSKVDGASRSMYMKDDSLSTYVSEGNLEFADSSGPGAENVCSSNREKNGDALDTMEFHTWRRLWKQVSEELVPIARDFRDTVAIDQQTMQRLVAPVNVQLEPDNYICYDQTDLTYQYAVIADYNNPMLLANYAQFLYLVQHDYNRAEEFFRRAMKADPVDGDVLGRFATFLWLARGDRAAAERAYKAAIAVDPNNSFHAGSYAHFLWHSGEEDTSCPLGPLA